MVHAEHIQSNIEKKMPVPKLFLYKARDAPIVAILRRGSSKNTWQLIRWDMDTDMFNAGQWLTKAIMNGAYGAISPDGVHFAYHYSEIPDWKCHAVVSILPYFSASLITHKHAGTNDAIAFDQVGNVLHTRAEHGFIKKRACSLKVKAYVEAEKYTGYVETGDFVDTRGRHITVAEGRILADGLTIYDTTEHRFVNVACPVAEIEPTAVMMTQ